jgi:N-acetylglutamate synthase-like GNAT family acetyltransferase
MIDKATALDGDIGPNGFNLLRTYSKSDRKMFVAVLQDRTVLTQDFDINLAEDCVVGCVAVKRGMGESDEEPESSVASIWRLSVKESTRRSVWLVCSWTNPRAMPRESSDAI